MYTRKHNIKLLAVKNYNFKNNKKQKIFKFIKRERERNEINYFLNFKFMYVILLNHCQS